MTSQAERMMAIFAGHMGAHGTHGVPEQEGLKWGIKKTARTLREPVSVELWEQHLSGTRPLGVIPINEDGVCSWGSIDVDQYDINLLEIVNRVERSRLPLLPCRSKSGGLHLFLFLKAPQQAGAVQAVLRDIAAQMGLAACEIFPKQSQVLSDRGDVGNWMVMPYFGGTFQGKLKEQVGLKKTGAELTIGEFLNAAEEAALAPEDFIRVGQRRAKAQSEPTAPFGDGPPCLQHLARGGFPEGGRNNALFHIGVYWKRATPHGWQQKIEETNQQFMKPPLNSEEVMAIIRSLEKKDYEYKCKDQPMASHCDASLCRTRLFGVGDEGNFPPITGLSKLETEPPIWFIDVGDYRLEASTDQLVNYYMMNKLFAEKCNKLYQPMKQDAWVRFLSPHMESVTIIESPPDVGVSGRFLELLEEFLLNRWRGAIRDDILSGRPWENPEVGKHFFRLTDLTRFLEGEGIKDMTRGQITQRIRRLGGGDDFFHLRGRGTNVWFVPDSVLQRTEPIGPPPVKGEVI